MGRIGALLEELDILHESGCDITDLETVNRELYDRIRELAEVPLFLRYYHEWRCSDFHTKQTFSEDHFYRTISKWSSDESKSGLLDSKKELPENTERSKETDFPPTSVSTGKSTLGNRLIKMSKSGLPKVQKSGLLPKEKLKKSDAISKILITLLDNNGTLYSSLMEAELGRRGYEIPPTSYKRYLKELQEGHRIRIEKVDGLNLISITPHGKRSLLEQRKPLSERGDETAEASVSTIGIRAHNLHFKIPFKVLSKDHLEKVLEKDLAGNGGHLVPRKMKTWTLYENTTEYTGISYFFSPTTLNIRIHEIYAPDPYDAVEKGFEVAFQTIKELAGKYEGISFQNIANLRDKFVARVDADIRKQHYAIPMDAVAEKFVQDGIKIYENKSNHFLVIDSSKSNELEFVDRKFAPEDAQTYLVQVYDMVRSAPQFRASDILQRVGLLERQSSFQNEVVNRVIERGLEEVRGAMPSQKTISRMEKNLVSVKQMVDSVGSAMPTGTDMEHLSRRIGTVEGMTGNMLMGQGQQNETLRALAESQATLTRATEQLLYMMSAQRETAKKKGKQKSLLSKLFGR